MYKKNKSVRYLLSKFHERKFAGITATAQDERQFVIIYLFAGIKIALRYESNHLLSQNFDTAKVIHIFDIWIKMFQSQGGFTSEESMQALSKKHLDLQYRALLLQYEALKSELEGLKTTNPTLAERIISLVASITTIAGFIML